MNIKQITEKRYSTKKFDSAKKISAADWEHIEAAMQNSPSSVNIQSWHYVVANDEAGKARIVKATEAFPFNVPKVADASHVVVFAARTFADDAFLSDLLEQEDKDGRYAEEKFKTEWDGARKAFLGIHRDQMKDEEAWLSAQTHIAIGFTLMAAAALGIDAIPMEGVDLAALDKEFGLTEKGYKAKAIVSFGYKAEDDFNAKLPKSRLEKDYIITRA